MPPKQPLTWGQQRNKRLTRVDTNVFSVYHTILLLAGLVALVLFW